jgi:hypothetical protein
VGTREQSGMMLKHPIIGALRDVTRELLRLIEGEDCDHSVGICWCETRRTISAAETILHRNGWEQHESRGRERAAAEGR